MYSSQQHFQPDKAFGEIIAGCSGIKEQNRLPTTKRKNRSKIVVLLLSVTFVIAVLIGGISYFSVKLKKESLAMQKSFTSPSLLIESTPIGAKVIVDGTAKGLTPLRLKLPAGKYEVKLIFTGYYDWEAQVEMLGENEIPLVVHLLPIKENIF
jgi:uncharacterized membrane protein YciS (DUF1049 family)